MSASAVLPAAPLPANPRLRHLLSAEFERSQSRGSRLRVDLDMSPDQPCVAARDESEPLVSMCAHLHLYLNN